MSKPITPVLRLADLRLEPFRHGQAYASQDAGLAGPLGLTRLGASYSEVPPGQSGCPFHVHHVEDEMFVILEGQGRYRFGDRSYEVRAGDVLGAPCGGPEFAHKLTNTGPGPLKYLSISTLAETEVCEYPDSGKFGVFSRRQAAVGERLRFLGRLEDGRDYWEGEDRPD